jgi:hypothetical protein
MRTELLLPVTVFLVMSEMILALITITEPKVRHYIYLTINGLALGYVLAEWLP